MQNYTAEEIKAIIAALEDRELYGNEADEREEELSFWRAQLDQVECAEAFP